MKLSEVFEQLSAGELSQLSIGGAETGAIDPSNYNKVLLHINLALSALYTRFLLKEGTLVLALQPGQYSYSLSSKYAESNLESFVPVKYIKDSTTPFKDDLLKVHRVIDATGQDWALNDEGNLLACRTPSTHTLVVPEDLLALGGDLRIVYRASHPKVTLDPQYLVQDMEEAEIELPYSHLQALLYFVASRFHNPIGMSNEFHAGNSYAAKYEAECARLEQINLQTDKGGQYNRLYANGWV